VTPQSSWRNGRGRGERVGVLPGLFVAVVILAACQLPARLGVPTTVEKIEGTCDTSAIVEVGASLPLSGRLAATGRAELAGLKLAVAHVNQSGGVLTSHRCLELMYKDDRSDPSVDNQALLDLVNQERVSLVVGPFLALSDSADRIHLGALGVTADSFSSVEETFEPRSYPYTFPMSASISTQAQILANDVKKHRWQQVTVLRSGSLASTEGASLFEADTRGAGIHVTTVSQSVDSRASASKVLAAVRSTHTDVLVVFDDGSTLTPVLVVRRAIGLSLPVIASIGDNTPELPPSDLPGVEVVVPTALEVTHSNASGLTTFRAQLLHALHRDHLQGALTPYAQAYDTIAMFAGAASGVNADDPGSLRTYLENTNYQGILGSYNFTSESHTGLDVSQESLVPLASLSNGIFIRPTTSDSKH
jgi:ABC-type branched-subunit amino acid transport system substrate-binding protein